MSIRYRLFFFLILLSGSAPLAAQAEAERHYRIELIVLRHLGGVSDSTPQDELRNLSEVLDLYAPVVETEDETVTPTEAVPELAAAEPGLETEPEIEEPIAIRVDEMSDTMRETWRRLRGSAGFRPELFRAWEQSGDEPFPVLRIHDDEVLFQIEPASLFQDAPVDEHGALVFSDRTLRAGHDGEELIPESMDDDLAEAPPIQYFYRVDGTANLSRSRFLHLDLDIELREALFDQPDEADAIPALRGLSSSTEMATSGEDEAELTALPGEDIKSGPAAEATSFRIHRIDQRRQVKTEQMEYFDGPVIGVLAWITGFDVIPESEAGLDPLQGYDEGQDEDTELAE